MRTCRYDNVMMVLSLRKVKMKHYYDTHSLFMRLLVFHFTDLTFFTMTIKKHLFRVVTRDKMNSLGRSKKLLLMEYHTPFHFSLRRISSIAKNVNDICITILNVTRHMFLNNKKEGNIMHTWSWHFLIFKPMRNNQGHGTRRHVQQTATKNIIQLSSA